MLEPSQEYFLIALLSFLMGLIINLGWRADKEWLLIFSVLLGILVACMAALFLIVFIGPDGRPEPGFWKNLLEHAVFIILPLVLGVYISKLVEQFVPKRHY